MAKFEQMQQALLMLKQLGLPISKEQIEALKEGEINLVNKKIAPKVKNLVEKNATELQNAFDLLVRYDPKKGVEVRVVTVTGGEHKSAKPQAKDEPQRHIDRRQFWTEFIDYCNKHDGLFAHMAPGVDYWMRKSFSKSIPNARIGVAILQDKCWVELWIMCPTEQETKQVFDTLAKYRAEIDDIIPDLEWQRREGLKSSRICVIKPYSYLNPNERQQIIEFFDQTSKVFREVFKSYAQIIKF